MAARPSAVLSLPAVTATPLEAILSERGATSLRAVGDDIWSVLPQATGQQQYDSIAAAYDRIVGNRIYQRLAWGNDVARDAQLARDAVVGDGWLLDAGCGSLVFTAEVHRDSRRPTVLLDLSVGMLQRARDRVADASGRVPDHLVLLQGDVLALPFAPASFTTVLCPGIIHLFEGHEALIESLASVMAPGADLFLSSLVTDRAVGAFLLRQMQNRGEVPLPIHSGELADKLRKVLGRTAQMDVQGNMAHARVTRASAGDVAPT